MKKLTAIKLGGSQIKSFQFSCQINAKKKHGSALDHVPLEFIVVKAGNEIVTAFGPWPCRWTSKGHHLENSYKET